jgi:hypothetical protein
VRRRRAGWARTRDPSITGIERLQLLKVFHQTVVFGVGYFVRVLLIVTGVVVRDHFRQFGNAPDGFFLIHYLTSRRVVGAVCPVCRARRARRPSFALLSISSLKMAFFHPDGVDDGEDDDGFFHSGVREKFSIFVLYVSHNRHQDAIVQMPDVFGNFI